MTQVFGPQRPVAALRAINRLAQVQERVAEYPFGAPRWLLESLAIAQDGRDMYAEYADAATAQARI